MKGGYHQFGPGVSNLPLEGEQDDGTEGGPDSKGRYNRPWQFSKTKMCKFEIIGMCAKGAQCPFAHSKDDLRPLPDLTCTKLCKTLIHTGSCTNTKCKYAHSKEELRATSTFHKTKLCRFAQIGHCALGVKCNFAHSQDEIRQLDPAAQQDLQILERMEAAQRSQQGQSAQMQGGADMTQGIIFPAFAAGQLVFPKQPVVVAPGYLGHTMPGLPQYLQQTAPMPSQPPQEASVGNQMRKGKHRKGGGKDRSDEAPDARHGREKGRGSNSGRGGYKGGGRGASHSGGQNVGVVNIAAGAAGSDGIIESNIGMQTAPGNSNDGGAATAPNMAAGADGGARALAEDPVAAMQMLGFNPAMGVMGAISQVPGLENFDWASLAAHHAQGMPPNTATGGVGPSPGMSPGSMNEATSQRRPSHGSMPQQPASGSMPNANARPPAAFSGHGHAGSFSAPSMPRVGSNSRMAGGPAGTAPSAASMLNGTDSFQDGPAYVTSTSSDFVVKNTFLDVGPIGAPLRPIRSIRSAAGRLDMLSGVDEAAQHSELGGEGVLMSGVDAPTAAAGLEGEGLGQMPRVGSHGRELHGMPLAQLREAMRDARQQHVDDADAAGGGHERTSVKASSSSGPAGLGGGMSEEVHNQLLKGGSFVVDQKDDMWQVKNTFLTYTPQVRPIRTVRTAEGALCTLGGDQP